MHQIDLDLSLSEITKIEGAASLNVKVRQGIVKECKFSINEFKRFYTQAIRGKPVAAIPQLVARICGTCSNAHLLCNIKALEKALEITPSTQTKILRQLLNYGLIIRDHALHLYVFVLPDLYGKNSILAFDEKIPEEHKLLDDCFAIKAAGNKLAIAAGGRSVHAPFATIGGFIKIPAKNDLLNLIAQLNEIRPKIIDLIKIFQNCTFKLDQDLEFVALIDDKYSFLEGQLLTKRGETFSEAEYGEHLEKSIIPHSQASGFRFDGKIHLVGALARINLNQKALHPNTKKGASEALLLFPSNNIFNNNLAQAIEILHAIDTSIDLINSYQGIAEKPVAYQVKESEGVGVIEAPRGILYHKMKIDKTGKIAFGEIVVPTGQNQIGIERSLYHYISNHLNQPKKTLEHEFEKIIRAYDPCMSCATHFLKVNWK